MSKKRKRKVDLLVLSDIHLGTFGCNAKELLQYLKSIKPKKVILNGDIIDIWQFKKRYFPKSHMKIIKHIFGWASSGVEVIYITGNHDEMLRKFVGFSMGKLSIQNKLVLELDGKKAWFFHGDVFDVTMEHSKWLAKLGAIGYDFLIIMNYVVNSCLTFLGKEKISLSKRVKDKVKGAVKFINNFEKTVTDIAMEKGYEYVVCGHIHQPVIKDFSNDKGKQTLYLNSGDWIENLTALEYTNSKWKLYKYHEDQFLQVSKVVEKKTTDNTDKSAKELFQELITEFNIKAL